jgi:hypothetical protein
MYNIFDNVKVFRDRTDTSEGQFRFRVEFSKPLSKGYRLITDSEHVIDTTEDRSECIAVALEMVREANREENRRIREEDRPDW